MTWRDMESAPDTTENILVNTKHGEYIAHFAQDLSGEDQPAFKGWFTKTGPHDYQQVTPIGWKPLSEDK